MLENRLISEFADGLREDAIEKASEGGIQSELALEAGLVEVAMGYLEELGMFSDYDLCPHEDKGSKKPCRIIGFSLADDSRRLELITGAVTQHDGQLAPKDLAKLAGWAARFFQYAAKGDHSRFADNAPALAAATRINAELNRIDEVRIHVITNGRFRDRNVNDISVLDRPVSTEAWDAERLFRVSGEDISRDKIEIDFEKMIGKPIPCLEVRPRPEEYETFLTILPGEVLFTLFEQFGPRLFEFNVRSFLQAKGAVNRGLQRTIKDEPGRFLAYNNGLTATADEIEIGMSGGETVIRAIRGLQIVNGAQTTASIHRARKADKVDITKIAVSLKLTKVPQSNLKEFVPLIARFANTQNPIQLADLAASETFHQQFEVLANTVWTPGEESRWFYERARGSYQMARNRFGTTPARRRDFDQMCPKGSHFGKTDLAKYLMTWWGFPHQVSKGAQKNHSAFMFSLRERYGETWEPDRDYYRAAISLAIIFKAAQGSVRKAKLQSYGANVVTYLVALLASQHGDQIDLEEVWQMQEVSPELATLLEGWAPQVHARIVETAGVRNVTEWCKKEDCWTEIQQVILSIGSEAPPEFAAAAGARDAKDGNNTVLQSEDAEQCMALAATTWLKVVTWASESPNVDEFDRRVAHTISGYALNGWSKVPTDKQAIRGTRVLRAAREAGVLDA